MNPFDKDALARIFILSPVAKNRIGSRESTVLEFKESFNQDEYSLASYAKTMASFANNNGGYIVFGIKDKPRELVGIKRDKFDTFDPAVFSTRINDHIQPSLAWDTHIVDWNGLSFGILYTYLSVEKPVIAVKNAGEIQEGDIYYRYNGKSEKIRYPELNQIINQRIKEQNEAWRRVVEKTASVGPVNAAIMDTVEGTITGSGGMLVIDDGLAKKLKFIKEGEFSEKRGSPTLKLVGDVVSAPIAAVREKRITVGEDIYKYRPSQVARVVQKSIGKGFSTSMHVKAWKVYKIRPHEKKEFKSQYCEYKQAENDYRYSQAWVDFLIQKLSKPAEYDHLMQTRIS